MTQGERYGFSVVDDFVDAADGLAIYLAKHGHLVRTAHDGLAALTGGRRIRSASHPARYRTAEGWTVFCVAGQIRQQLSLQSACLIAVTGFGRPEDMRLAHEAGFDHFLVKPDRLHAAPGDFEVTDRRHPYSAFLFDRQGSAS